MMRNVGTIVRGIRTPIIKEGDNLEDIVVSSLLKASQSEGFEFNDKDVVAITEAVVGISERNFATLDDIAGDIKSKLKSDHIGIVFPILSRNRFAVLLSAMARSAKKLTLLLSYPSDEVGNDILYKEDLKKYNVNPYSDIITYEDYMEKYHRFLHPFTGVNMVDVYKELIEKEGCVAEIVLSNNALDILKYTNDVINCDIHTREETKELLKNNGANVISMSDILNKSYNGSGYNEKYGLLGTNRATEERVKLFPRTGQTLVENVQKRLKEETGKNIEVMVYGDGAFKDPVGHIWELADPVVSPAYTKGLEGSPNELKLKYLSENKFKNLSGEDLNNAIREEIKNKDNDLKGKMASQGTTPRRYTDLLGSLCDLTSGSGDKGTPVVLIQRYFNNYSD
ncbi:MAG: coenzyme F420-0:L-glutamate ligase [Bacilli bacterium]|nr:coenzyme F420-0:L-glutamate ligase [Bacilli bacterium]MBQ6282924.1 coenzyme F420-0:L-glutamate ligase [Bacilli bacterium]